MSEGFIKGLLDAYGLGISGWVLFILALIQIRRLYQLQAERQDKEIERLMEANKRFADSTATMSALAGMIGDTVRKQS